MKTENFQEGVLCKLSMGWWSAQVKVKKEKYENLPQEIIRARQELLDDKSMLKNIASTRREALRLLQNNSLPFPIDGLFWVSKEKINDLDRELNKLLKDNDEKLELFLEEYENLKNQFKEKYPEYWRPEKYPSAESLRSKFYLNWQFLQISNPNKSVVSPSIYKREAEKLKNMVAEIETMTINMIGNALAKRIESLSSQLGEGTANALTIHSFENFFTKWDSLWKDHVDQKSLRITIARLRKQLRGADAQDIKNSSDLQEKLSGSLEKAMKSLESVPGFQLKRKLDI